MHKPNKFKIIGLFSIVNVAMATNQISLLTYCHILLAYVPNLSFCTFYATTPK